MPRKYIGGLMGASPLAGDPVDLRTSGVFNLGSLGGDGPASGDAEFDNVVLLLDGNGDSNQTTFTDLSNVQTPITTFGNAQVDTTVKKFGSGSIEFDGSGDYLRTNDFGLTSGDFTIEAWVRLKAMPTSDSWPAAYNSWMEIVGVGTASANDGWQFRIGQTLLAFGVSGDNTAVTGTHGMSTGTWYHLAVTRSGNVYTVYVDGSSVGSATYTAQQPGSGAYGWIGTETAQGAYLNGYIDDLRITKGVARYSTSFTPPTSALSADVSDITGSDDVVLLLDGDGTSGSTTFTDESSSPHTITVNGDVQVYGSKYGTGSIKFDGTGDYLEVDFQNNIGVSRDPFTVECWVYFDTLNDEGVINLTQGGFGQGGNSLAIGYYNSEWRFYDDNTGTATGVTPGPSTGQWYHTAIVFDDTDLVFYINGQARLTRSNHFSNMPAGGYPTVIFGGYFGAGYELDGKIDDIRVTKGAALYSSNFTPPTSALTNTVSSGTVVLRLNGDGTSGSTTFIDQSSSTNTITANGDVQVIAPKYGTGSIKFDGTGDYLDVSVNSDFTFDGDFTVEAWVYPNTAGTFMPIIDGRADNNAFQNYYFGLTNVSQTLRTDLILASGGTGRIGTTNAVPTGQWSHIAFVRNNGVITPYVNGVPDATTKSDSNTLTPSNFRVGATPAASATQYYFDGYIDDIRVTKGAALYPDTGRTGELVPPTSALPTTGTVAGATRPTRKWGGMVGRSILETTTTTPSWSPADITTYAWFDGDDNTTIYTDTGKTTNATNGQDVQLWADKSGNSRDIQKIGTSNVPNYNSSGLNSKGVLQSNVYDGLEHQLSTNFTSGDWEVYTVVKVNDAAGGADSYARIMSFGAASGTDYNNTSSFMPLYYSNVANTFQSYQNSSGGPTLGGYTNGTFRLISARSDSGTAYISADGGTESTSSKTFTANATGFRLFAPVQTGIGNNLSASGTASDSFLDGAIAELVFISGNLSSTDKQKLEGYLSHKWGLEGNLSSSHPYKTKAPSLTTVSTTSVPTTGILSVAEHYSSKL